MKAEAYYAGGQMLPDHRTVLVSVNVRAGGGSHRLVALDTRTGNQKTVLENAGIVRYAPSSPGSQVGYLIYYDPPTGSLVAASFNAERLTVNGTPVPIIEGVQSLAGPFGVFAFSDNGSLIYVRATGTFGERTLVWVDRNGGEQPTAAPLRPYNLPRLSPAGDRVAVEVQDPRTQTVDIWVYDLLRGSATRITHQNRNVFPVWMPDGKRLLLGSGTAPTYVLASAPADGSTAPVPISTSSEAGCFPDSVSPDAKLVIGRGRGGRGGRGNSTCLWSLAEASAIKVTQNDFGRIDMQFSPDGRFVAYTSNESGRNEIYIEPAPGAPSGTGGKHTISVDGGNTPRWSRTGRELFYLNTGKMMAVDIQTSPSFTAGKPKMLFEGPYSNGYDVAPDGKRFLMVKANAPPTATAQTELHFVLNWFEELQRRAPAAK
jgi:Tol biopolymer transport system component